MPVYRASGLFNCGSSSPGLQACTDPVHGTFRPKLIWLLPLYTGTANNCYWHRGCVAEDAEQNVTQWALGIRSADNASSATVRTARYTDRAWVQVISSGIGCDGTVSIGDAGFTPTVSTVNAAVDVAWVALGGDVEEAVCVAVDITPADADGTVPVEVGFAPDVVIAATSAVSAINNTHEQSNSSACFGWATRADTAGVSYAQRRVRGADPTTNWSSSDAVLFQSLTNTVGWTATVGAWHEDGVDLAITGTPGLSSQILYLVLARGGEWRTVTTTGDGEATQLVPVSGVDPVAVMAQSWGRAPSANVIDGDILSSFGIAAAGGQASEWGSDADAVGTTQADGTYTTDSLIYVATVNAPATVQAEAAVSSFGREALNLAWNPVDSVGRELQFLVVGDEAAELEPITGTLEAVAPIATVSATDSNEVTGSASVTAPPATVSATGVAYTVHVPVGGVVLSGGPGLVQTIVGEAAVTAPAAEASASGTSTIIGAVEAQAPSADAEASGTSTVPGTATLEAPAASAEAFGSPVLTSSAVAEAPLPAVAVAGTLGTGAVLVAVPPPAYAAISGSPVVTGAAQEIAAPAAIVAVVGTPVLTAELEVTAELPGVQALAGIDVAGTLSVEAPAPSVAGQGAPVVAGTVGVTAALPVVFGTTSTDIDGQLEAASQMPVFVAAGSPVVAGQLLAQALRPQVALSAAPTGSGVVEAMAPVPNVVVAGTPVLTAAASLAASAAQVGADGTVTLLGGVQVQAPGPDVLLYSGLLTGEVQAVAPGPTVEIKDYTGVWYLSVIETQMPFELSTDEGGRQVYAFNVQAHKAVTDTFTEELVEFIQQRTSYRTFAGSTNIPKGDGPFIHVLPTSGLQGLRVQNQVGTRIDRPSAQILVRAKSQRTAMRVSHEMLRLLTSIRNQELVVPSWATE